MTIPFGLNTDQGLSLFLLALTFALFVWGRYRHDIVALITLTGIGLSGLVPPSELVSGFGHPAVITVAAVLIVSQALKNSGVVDIIASRIEPFTQNAMLHVVVLTGTVAVASAFMNNVGALAILLPVALTSAAERNRPPARLLMPLAFGSILGGMMTMIGTPPNILIASIREEATGEAFQMFDFSFVGLPVAFIGVLFIAAVGWRLIPRDRQGGVSPETLFHIEDYIVEARVRAKSQLIGKRITHLTEITGEDVTITGKVNAEGKIESPDLWRPIDHNDVLVLKADPTDIQPLVSELGIEILSNNREQKRGEKKTRTSNERLGLTEAMVTPDSPLLGRGPATLSRRSGYSLSLLAIARMDEPVRRRLHNARFQTGDVLLLQRGDTTDPDIMADMGLLPLPERGLALGRPRQALLSLGIFAAAISLSVAGILPIAAAFLAAIVAYVVLGILPVRDLYHPVDWPVVVLLGAMIPLGAALEHSGTTALIASGIVTITASLPPWAILALIMAATMFISDIINNTATALVMAPIAIAVSRALELSMDPFLMAVAVGASCAFLTPIGHQSNTLVMGPGGYRFGDYWRLGLPLEVLIIALGVPLILVAWPL